jgi:hypothetical protein
MSAVHNLSDHPDHGSQSCVAPNAGTGCEVDGVRFRALTSDALSRGRDLPARMRPETLGQLSSLAKCLLAI